MAEIFLAKALGVMGFERLVAIKLIHSHLTRDSEFVKMFIDEARIAMHLHHRNIVQTFDLDKADDTYFIAMEFVHGVNLYDVYERIAAKQRWIELPLALYIIAEASKGLHFAHTRMGSEGKPLGIVHRDISPQNILLSFEGEVKITDFGIAKAAERLHQTTPGIVKGKYAYMAPEVLQDRPADARVDVFAAGVVLYELLVGENPFAGQSAVETIENVLNTEVPRPTQRGAPGSAELDRIVLKALAKDPDQRYQTGQELADALTEYGLSQTTARRDIAQGDMSISTLLTDLFPEKSSRMPGQGAPERQLVIPMAERAASGISSNSGNALNAYAVAQTAETPAVGLDIGTPTEEDISDERTMLQMAPVDPSAHPHYEAEADTSLDLETGNDRTEQNRAVSAHDFHPEPATDQALPALRDDDIAPEDRTVLSSGFLAQQIEVDGRQRRGSTKAPKGPPPAPLPTSAFQPLPATVPQPGLQAINPPPAFLPPPGPPTTEPAPQPGLHAPPSPQPFTAPALGATPNQQQFAQNGMIGPGSMPELQGLGEPQSPGRRTATWAAVLVVIAAVVVAATVFVRWRAKANAIVTIPITSVPSGATVTINGKTQPNKTPLNAMVPVGRNHVIVISAEGHEAYTKEIRPVAGIDFKINAELAPK